MTNSMNDVGIPNAPDSAEGATEPHALKAVKHDDYGWTVECRCGWVSGSSEFLLEPAAREFDDHLSEAPASA